MSKLPIAVSALCALVAVGGCKTVSSAANGVASAGQKVASTASGAATSLVNVNLSNVLNNLAVQLHVDRANIPINAQIPISIAANVCGVTINILSIGAGGGSSKGCTAVTTSPELAQAVQQQMSTGGGTQTSTTPTTTTPTTTTPTTQPQPTTEPQPDSTTPPKLN
jgi:hypothetical protein